MDRKLPPEDELLSRDDFRELTFQRDGHRCVFCGAPAQDAHHIMERRLFPDGGYRLGNGISVCEKHHLECERTLISVEEARAAAGIKAIILPPQLYSDVDGGQGVFDKWGNIILPNGLRTKGELFYDESVQKVLGEGGVLGSFTDRVKYARTYHVDFSPGVTSDDRVIDSYAAFEGQRIIASLKLDGEGASIYSDGFVHARSIDTEGHPSRNRIRALAAAVGPELPRGWRLCGENVYAKHAIHYQHLPAHFLVISIWNERNICLSWDETVEWAKLLGLETVPVLYDGPFDLELLKKLHTPFDANGDEAEGWVIRVAAPFAFSQFRTHSAKWVRRGHVAQGSHHWRLAPVIPNGIRPKTASA